MWQIEETTVAEKQFMSKDEKWLTVAVGTFESRKKEREYSKKSCIFYATPHLLIST